MPLPPSGPLSINQIRNELGSSSGSLRTLSSLAGFSTPDAMSEFYGYGATARADLINYSYYGYIQININGEFRQPIFGYGNQATYTMPAGASMQVNAGDTLSGSIVDVYINSSYSGSYSGNFVLTPTYTVIAGYVYVFYHNDMF